jgi:nitrite reductase/ring-hydroxylating ferredoxin subunit
MSWQPVASIEDAERVRTWLAVHVDGRDLALARIAGEWFAVEDRCAHAGCAFSEDGSLEGDTIVCNCHGSEYDLRTGALRRGPADRPVRSFPVRVAGGRLEVEV